MQGEFPPLSIPAHRRGRIGVRAIEAIVLGLDIGDNPIRPMGQMPMAHVYVLWIKMQFWERKTAAYWPGRRIIFDGGR